jgi:hypothetical protein
LNLKEFPVVLGYAESNYTYAVEVFGHLKTCETITLIFFRVTKLASKSSIERGALSVDVGEIQTLLVDEFEKKFKEYKLLDEEMETDKPKNIKKNCCGSGEYERSRYAYDISDDC